LISFAAGYLLIMLPARRFWPLVHDTALAATISERRVSLVAGALVAIGIVAMVVQVRSVIAQYGLIGWLVDPLGVREAFMLSGWGALFQVNIIAPAVLVLRHRARGGRWDGWTVCLGLLVLISLLLANQKSALVKAGIVAIGAATVFATRIRLRTLVVACLILLVFFVGYARITSPYYHGDHRFYVRDGHIHLPRVLAPLGNPYHYMTSGYGNFQVFADDQEYLQGGRQTLRPLRYVWLRLQGSREIESHHGQLYTAPLYGNTMTYLRQFYADFGVAGPLILPAFLGAFVAWLFVEIVRRGRSWLAPCYGVALWCLFISFFSNHWIYFGTWLLATIALLAGLAMRRSADGQPAPISDSPAGDG
jgi:oligosaccharide repeat unit polymerase